MVDQSQITASQIVLLYGGAGLFLIIIGYVIPTFINYRQNLPEKKRAYVLIKEALGSGNYRVLEKNMWRHPEGAGETYLTLLLNLSNGKVIRFETTTSSGIGGSRYKIVENGETTDFKEIKMDKTSRMIVNFFWTLQERQYQEAQEAKRNQGNRHLASF